MMTEVNIGDMVCDGNLKHQRVVWKSGTTVGMEDGTTHDLMDIDVVDHPYKHLVDSMLATC